MSCQYDIGYFNANGSFEMENANVGSGTMSLYYKLYKPNTASAMNKVPGIILIHGSGPQNHDEQVSLTVNDTYSVIYKPFEEIGNYLCDNYNIAVMTYDKRSCSSLQGCFNKPEFCGIFIDSNDTCVNVTLLTYNDFVGDSIAAYKYIRDNMDYIDNDKIIFAGHSQGASIAPYVSSYMNIDYAMSLMGTGVPIDQVILWQEEYLLQWNESRIEEDRITFELIMNQTLSGFDVVNILDSPSTAIFWYEWLMLEQSQMRLNAISQLKHIYTINSDADSNVPPWSYHPLHELIDTIGGNYGYPLDASMNEIHGLIHLFISISDFTNNVFKVSPKLLHQMGSYINQVTDSSLESPNDSACASNDAFNAFTFIMGIASGIGITILLYIFICIVRCYCCSKNGERMNLLPGNRFQKTTTFSEMSQNDIDIQH